VEPIDPSLIDRRRIGLTRLRIIRHDAIKLLLTAYADREVSEHRAGVYDITINGALRYFAIPPGNEAPDFLELVGGIEHCEMALNLFEKLARSHRQSCVDVDAFAERMLLIGSFVSRQFIKLADGTYSAGKRQRAASPKRRKAAEKTNIKRRAKSEADGIRERVAALIAADAGPNYGKKTRAVNRASVEFDISDRAVWRYCQTLSVCQ
jgi:hypothetical protein